jgi:hypothetical protein
MFARRPDSQSVRPTCPTSASDRGISRPWSISRTLPTSAVLTVALIGASLPVAGAVLAPAGVARAHLGTSPRTRTHHPRSPRRAASAVRPVLEAHGRKLTWRPAARVSRYVLATLGHPSVTGLTTYRVLKGTSFTPPDVSGQTMKYRLRASSSAAPWSKAVSIKYSAKSAVNIAPAGSSSPTTMTVGLNGGWGDISAANMAGVLGIARIDTTEGGTELPSTYHTAGIKSVPMFPGDVGGGYDSGGVSAINIPNWINMVTAYYANQCSASTDVCPAIEVLNEPNGSWFWGANAEDARNEAAYGALITAVYNGFHTKYGAASPKILLAYDDPTWWAGIVAANPNIRNYFDGAIVHPYGGTGSVASSALGDRALVTQAHNDTGKPVWATEVGWPTAVGQPATGDSLQWTQTQQAANIYNFVNWARSTGYVASVLYFNYRDYGTNNSYGVESSTGAKKPGWYALAEAANEQPCTVC